METDVNMITILGIILSIIGGFVMLLLSFIAYFLKQKDKRQELTNEKLSVSIDKLYKATSGLNAIILTNEESLKGLEKRFDDHKVACDGKFIKKK